MRLGRRRVWVRIEFDPGDRAAARTAALNRIVPRALVEDTSRVDLSQLTDDELAELRKALS
jgi:hypothetical protein